MNYNQTSVYPTLPDNLIFFQDPDIDMAPLLQQYYEYIENNQFAEAADYLNRTDLHFYGAGLLNMIEKRLLQTEQYCPEYVGTKADIHAYSETQPSDMSAPYKISWVGLNEVPVPLTGVNFIPKADVIKWLDDIPTGGMQAFNAHMGIDIIDTSNEVGWHATTARWNGRLYSARRHVFINSVTFSGVSTSNDVIIALGPTTTGGGIGTTYLAPFPGYSNIPVWIPWSLTTSRTIGTYTFNIDDATYVGTTQVAARTNVDVSGVALCCCDHYADKAEPNTTVETFEWDCLIKMVGFRPGTIGTYTSALNAYVANPTAANKQAIIDALQNSVNP